MTPVHVNRVLRDLRADGLIDLNSKMLTVLDFDRLKEVAQYEVDYLHLVRTERRDGAVSERADDLVPASSHGRVHQAVERVKHPFGKSQD
jgi:hypothetical protein